MNEVKNNMVQREQFLADYATKSKDAIKINPEKEDFRPAFYRDIDKIVYSLAYSRYIDKTQVFTDINNDHVCKRIIHVQLVSKIARTIGRALNLNEDLIEAMALGHDLGHVPFGHEGEKILNEISLKHNEGYFNHNVHSVRTLLYIENKNISIQTLDGILCHNGEIVCNEYRPKKKTKEQFFEDYQNTYLKKDYSKELTPMTLEGCVVRISDIIGYIGRDVEDAIRLGIISKENLPESVVKLLGNSNTTIIETLVTDIIKNSINKPYIKMSDEVYFALKDLIDFNYQNIYLVANTKETKEIYALMFNTLFDKYLEDLKNKNLESDIYQIFLKDQDQEYLKNTNERIVIDYIAGMTDAYFLEKYNTFAKK